MSKKKDGYILDNNRPQSVGKLRAFVGNFGNLVRAYAYVRTQGADGIRVETAEQRSSRRIMM